jgi:hypothetical protein
MTLLKKGAEVCKKLQCMLSAFTITCKKEYAAQNYSYAWNNTHFSVGRGAENERKM